MSNNNLDSIEILIPTYNEAGNLPSIIESLRDLGIKNITILDGMSEDNTVEVAKNYNCKILIDEKKKIGFGHSVINGIKNSDKEYLCIFDGDGSFDPQSVVKMHELLLNKKLDFVFGSRYLHGNRSDDDTIVTKIGNFFFSKLISLLFDFKTTDALFLFLFGKRNSFNQLNVKEQDFKICTELLIKAHTGFKTAEIFSHESQRLHGVTKVNRLKDGFLILKHILLMYLKK